jgi:uncharacterized MAPEG superfamily protein
MTIAIACLLVAALMPYLTIAPAKYHRSYDNRAPRDWALAVAGWRKRAIAAHLNHFEAFAPFAAGLLAAELVKAPQGAIDGIALVFIASRIGYTACYFANKAALRSLVWMVGFGCTVALYAVALAAR